MFHSSSLRCLKKTTKGGFEKNFSYLSFAQLALIHYLGDSFSCYCSLESRQVMCCSTESQSNLKREKRTKYVFCFFPLIMD